MLPGVCACVLGPGFARAFGGQAVFEVSVQRGRDAVLSRAGELEALTARVGQHGAALGLEYVLDEEFASRKIPYLVCVNVEEDGMWHLVGAALLFEYRVGGVPTGLMATGDSFGVRTVFGAEELRHEIATAAVMAMPEHGARLVLVSFKQHAGAGALPVGGEGFRWAVRERAVQDSMPVGATLEETLAGLGKKTRTGLRAVRRRFDASGFGVFVADAMGQILLNDDGFLLALNRASLDPIGQGTFNLQLRATGRLRGGFVCGLRATDGRWLALLGGWRHGRTTWVEWQVNVKGFEKMSLGSVLRSYLLEEEAARGTERLGFHGSTSHSMAHSFLKERVVDVIGRRRSLLASLLVRFVPVAMARSSRLAGRGNFLADGLGQAPLVWTPAERSTGRRKT